MKLMRKMLIGALSAVALATTTAATVAITAAPVMAAEASLDKKAQRALQSLLKSNSTARDLNSKAVAVMVFPEVLKAGLLIGGQSGEGVLLRGGKPTDHYRLVSASYGLQAGVQRYGYALFIMKEDGLKYLNQSDGWEVGVGPSVVMVDKGFARSTSSTTLLEDVYAIVFNQEGLMAGMGLQGSKISKIDSK